MSAAGRAWSTRLACVLCMAIATAAPSHAADAAPTSASAPPASACGHREPDDPRPRVGLALGGGGARGIAHVSVLRTIEEMHIPVDCVAGTSMGALVGGLYAAGMEVDAMERLVRSTDWKRLFDDSIERPERSYRRKQDDRDGLATLGVGIADGGLKVSPGLLQGERILAMFERQTQGVSTTADFDRLPIPFRAVATDLNTGEAVVLDHGSLAMAMRASMSLPGVFQPAQIEGRVLLDGGLVNQVPVDVVREMGADVVIAVDVGTPLDTLGSDASLLAVVSQIAGMMTTGNTRRQLATLAPADVLIVPELGTQVATGDFEKAADALAIGARASAAARPRLARLSVPAPQYAQLRAARPQPAKAPPVVEFVRIENHTPYADALVEAMVPIPRGEPLDADAVEAHLLRAYGLGTLSSITYEVIAADGRTGVLLRVQPKPQGPHYVQAGLSVNTDFQGTYESNLRAAVLSSPLSPLGAEGRVQATIGSEPGIEAEYYHPLDVANRYLLYARLGYENPNVNVFDAQGANIATYDVRRAALELRAAREFGNHAALVAGVLLGRGSAAVEVGDPGIGGFDFDEGRLFASLTVDRLDSLFFPRDGHYGSLGYTISRDWLGSDTDYDQLDFDALGARSIDRHSVQLGLSYHVTTSGELPVQDRYRLGGRARLAGFRLNQLTGQHYAMALVGYTYLLSEFFGRSAVVGGTLEYGNAWERRRDMALDDGILNASAYLGFDSWVGPMLLGVGWREQGDGVVFLEIGRPF